jgi:hypothetical protein
VSDWEPFYRSGAGVNHFRRWNGDGTVSYLSDQDAQPFLEQNKAAANHNDGYSQSRELRRVASIPFGLILQWKAEEGWDALDPANADRLARKLNDPAYAYLRTAPGRVGVSNGELR